MSVPPIVTVEDGTLHLDLPFGKSTRVEVELTPDDGRALAVAILRTQLPPAWGNLVEALTIMGQHPTSEIRPTQCSHDMLTVMADPASLSDAEKLRLDELSFTVDEYEMGFQSALFGSA
jgi:hypothetical protein